MPVSGVAAEIPQGSQAALLIEKWNGVQNRRSAGAPDVTVIVPAYNHIEVTIACLESIADSWPAALAVQVIVVDDASSDATGEVLRRLMGLDYVRNGQNAGFLRSCNRGAALAAGKYICFLNNDTTVQEGWLESLVTRAESDQRIGAVGAKLVYPDGKLQEAGAIIWKDATGWNYGRAGDPADARYNYVRDVDYCSGAALLVRRDLFERIGGFDETFAPAYYEDVDLCFALRDLGYRVVYEPSSQVVHYEGISSGTDLESGVKKYQQINLPKFREKWASDLQRHFDGDVKNVPAAARRARTGHTILVIDSYVPMQDKDAGSMRLLRLIAMMREAGNSVLFLPDNYAPLQPYTAKLQSMGVEVLHHTDNGPAMEKALGEVLPFVDIAWICRPQLLEKYAPMIRRNPGVRIIYDTIDLHFLRQRRESEIRGNGSDEWKKMEAREIGCARSADATVVVSECEKSLLESYDVGDVAVIPTIHEIERRDVPGFEEREGILFIGGYNHPPNADAVIWLCSEIMPLVWKKERNAHVTLLGSDPPPDVLAMASDRVRVTGYVRDVEPFFLKSRVFVAPMRFGAGLKGKVGHSLGYGLPVVTNAIGSEGFGLHPGDDFLLAETKEEFADAIVRLYSDRDLWQHISDGSFAAVAPFTSAAVQPRLESLLNSLAATVRA